MSGRQPKKRQSKPKRTTRKREPGRPTKRTPAVVKRILDGLAKGTPLTIICEPNNMPTDRTVREWCEKDTEFSSDIARAREAGFDRIAMDALAIADTPLEGQIITDKPDGREIKRSDMLGHRRLQVETRLKLLAKWDPKRYGEKITQEISGPDGGPVRTEGEARLTPEDEEMIRRIADARDRIRRPAEGAAEA